MEAKSVQVKIEDGASDGTGPGVSIADAPVPASPRAVCSALNRLIITGRDEILALNVAARIVGAGARRARLREQAARRLGFQHDIMSAVTALGGVPVQHASSRARLMAGARRIRELLIGPHAGDSYAVCARAAEKSVAAYSRALRLALPADVRFGVESQYAEIESDRSELSRLRWDASTLFGQRREIMPETTEEVGSRSRSALEDEHALEAWTEDGGAAQGRRPVASSLPRFSGAMR